MPGFKPFGNSISGKTESIHIIHWMTHTSGLQSYAPLNELRGLYTVPALEA